VMEMAMQRRAEGEELQLAVAVVNALTNVSMRYDNELADPAVWFGKKPFAPFKARVDTLYGKRQVTLSVPG